MESVKKKKLEWSNETVIALINLCQEEEVNTGVTGNYTKAFWSRVAKKLNFDLKCEYTAEQCKVKHANLKAQYKTQKEKANKSGEGRVKWEHFELMSKFMDDRPEIDPVALVNSSGTVKLKQRSDSNESVTMSDDEKSEVFHAKKKRKVQGKENKSISLSDALDRFTESANNRHKERLERKDKLVSLFEKYLQRQ